jgi:hypothetical protein
VRTTEIPRKYWGDRLDNLSKEHEGWLVSLDIVSPQPLGEQHEFRQMPLVGITSEPMGSGTITIAVAEPTGDQVTHLIHSPTRVFIVETKAGAHAALTIDSADGLKAVLRFRTTEVPS